MCFSRHGKIFGLKLKSIETGRTEICRDSCCSNMGDVINIPNKSYRFG